jgi:ABC-2 type transport system ATP-binding protein
LYSSAHIPLTLVFQLANRNATFIVVRELTKQYCGQVALNDVSFSMKTGGVVGVIGPNKAGKRSILKILAGIIAGTSGALIIKECSVSENIMRAKQYVSSMPENHPLPDQLAGRTVFAFSSRMEM